MRRKRFGCSAPIFAPRCDQYTKDRGCFYEGHCAYKYEEEAEEEPPVEMLAAEGEAEAQAKYEAELQQEEDERMEYEHSEGPEEVDG